MVQKSQLKWYKHYLKGDYSYDLQTILDIMVSEIIEITFILKTLGPLLDIPNILTRIWQLKSWVYLEDYLISSQKYNQLNAFWWNLKRKSGG